MNGVLRKFLGGDRRDSQTRSVCDHPAVIERIERVDLRLSPGASDSERNRAIREALSLTVGLKDDVPIGLVMPRPGSFVGFAKLPPVDRSKIGELVKFEATQSIPFDMDEVVWTYRVTTPEDGPDIECCIVACGRQLIEQDLALFAADRALLRRVDLLQVTDMTFADYLWNCHFAHAARQESGHIVGLNMYSNGTSLVITDGTALWSRWISIGSQAFATAPVVDLESPPAAAADLLTEIQRSVGFFFTTHREAELKDVAFVGDGFDPNLREYVSKGIQLAQVQIPFARGVRKSLAVDGAVIERHGSSVTDAITVAMQRLGIGKFRINLHPDSDEPFGLGAQRAWGVSILENSLIAVLVSKDSESQ